MCLFFLADFKDGAIVVLLLVYDDDYQLIMTRRWFNLLSLGITALWVKSGNRGNLKCLKVDDHFALIFHQKMFISFLSDAKLPKVYDRYLGLVIYVKYLMSYLQKTRRGGQGSLKFCVLAN